MAYRWTTREKFKRGVWSVAVAAVISVGAVTGAQLKTDKQKRQAAKQLQTTPTAEQIAILEAQKVHLLQQKAGLERRLALFRERAQEREAGKK
ncbi:uncharacterized protein UV8b_06072 [Ustilaginoidea virens]|uniref:Uncharacterized protein n=1 Tax=Ustilaginoidea virens TaxID=1159556 RepID=A0A063BYV5_USTVR|nr:uncharacterized protein UV8b_06072 [Ustilaginoidea virens]QUC21831.1 hypothetical protein UV8b_06072 [Ustilaginoidea virens]GAO17604.1 hypothetical protein UVI_02050870 [Ustilaginoidea virens]